MPARNLRMPNHREQQALEVMRALHAEFGDDSRFDLNVIEHVSGEQFGGSLGMLAMDGYVKQRTGRATNGAKTSTFQLTKAGRDALERAAKSRVQIVVPPGVDGRVN